MKKSWTETLYYEIKGSEDLRYVVDIAKKAREARLRWYGHIIRRDEGELLWNEEIRGRCEVVDIAEKVSKVRLRGYGHIIRR
jgi:hypothetical protein